MTRVVHGVVHGKLITLVDDPGVADGQEVQIVLTPVTGTRPGGDGIRRSAGGWAEYPELDAVMEQIQRNRKRERRSQVAE